MNGWTNIEACGLLVPYMDMRLSRSDLFRAIARSRLHIQDVGYLWYRDVICQAQAEGLLRITQHDGETPFWWRPFDSSVEILDVQLRDGIQNGTLVG